MPKHDPALRADCAFSDCGHFQSQFFSDRYPTVWIDNITGAPFSGQETQIERERIASLERAVIDAVMKWERCEVDDSELHKVAEALIAAREKK